MNDCKIRSMFSGDQEGDIEGSAPSGAMRRARLASAGTSPPATSRDRGVNASVDKTVLIFEGIRYAEIL